MATDTSQEESEEEEEEEKPNTIAQIVPRKENFLQFTYIWWLTTCNTIWKLIFLGLL